MIPSQRHLFDLPDDVTYLNCAYTSPLLRAAARAGEEAIGAKTNPWTIEPEHFFSGLETLRRLFGRLIGCPADHVAIVPAASYAIALAAKKPYDFVFFNGDIINDPQSEEQERESRNE